MSVLSQAQLHDEVEAFKWVEAILWPSGPVCPFCGVIGKHYDLGKTRIGLRKCCAKECRKQFTVRVGTIFESTHIPLHKWLQAIHLLCSSKKGFSSHQLHRVLEVTYKTAWFLSHRVRHAMQGGELGSMGGFGSSGIVEADETFVGRKKGVPVRRAYHHKNAVMSLVERGGRIRNFHIERADAKTVMGVIRENVAPEARIMTDEAKYYNQIGGEYVNDDTHTNTLENFYSVFKRGMKGVYQHCSEKHLHRYVDEFGFRHNKRSGLGVEDEARAEKALKGVKGKRLTYRPTDGA